MTANASRGGFQTEQWIVCQIGAREHYVLAAELHRRGQLAALCTDIWIGERSLWRLVSEFSGTLGRKLRDRYEPSLRSARVFFPVALQYLERKAIAGFARRTLELGADHGGQPTFCGRDGSSP